MPKRSSSNRSRPTEAVLDASRAELERKVLRQLRVVYSSAKMHFRAVKQRSGVTGAQLWALIEIHDHPGLRVSELAQ